MSRFADSHTESRISGIERDLSRKSNEHEVFTLRSDVASLERTVGELCSDIAWLRNELQATQGQIIQMLERSKT